MFSALHAGHVVAAAAGAAAARTSACVLVGRRRSGRCSSPIRSRPSRPGASRRRGRGSSRGATGAAADAAVLAPGYLVRSACGVVAHPALVPLRRAALDPGHLSKGSSYDAQPAGARRACGSSPTCSQPDRAVAARQRRALDAARRSLLVLARRSPRRSWPRGARRVALRRRSAYVGAFVALLVPLARVLAHLLRVPAGRVARAADAAARGDHDRAARSTGCVRLRLDRAGRVRPAARSS